MAGFEIEFDVAPLGDFNRPLERLGPLGEQLLHFLRRFEVKLARLHAHAVRVLERFAGLDAHERFLRLGVLLAEIMHVVRRDDGHVHLAREPHQLRQHRPFLGDAVILDFDEEILPAEEADVSFNRAMRGFVLTVQKRLRHLALQARGQADQPLRAPLEQPVINAGAVIKPARPRVGDEVGEVFVARFVFTQQDEVVIIARHGAAIVHIGADITFAADDGMDAELFGGGVKIDRAVHHAVIGDGAVTHALVANRFHERIDAAGAVEQAVFRMQMKMIKINHA